MQSNRLNFPPPSHPVELVAFDMDGTLLTEHFDLSPATVDAVGKLQANGIQVILISGRMVAALRPFHKQLGLSAPVIGYNGGLVWDVVNEQPLAHTPAAYAPSRKIVEFAKAEGLHFQWFWNDRFFCEQRNKWMDLYESRTSLVGNVIDSMDEFGEDRCPTKMLIITEPPQVLELVESLGEKHRGELYVTTTLPEYVELMNPNVSKGLALTQLGEQLGIPTERMVAFGDAPNDLTMMEVVGLSVAMGNARDSVKQQADLVTHSNSENGIAAALEALGLI